MKPKLALIPSGYKQDKIYSILPNDGSGDFTFVRDSEAARVNEDGLIEVVDVDVPRLDYSNSCPALLIEPESTNSLEYSEDITNWSTGGTITTTANQTISPSGEFNADLMDITNSQANYILQIVTPYTGKATYSVFVKKGDIDEFSLRTIEASGIDSYINFNFDTQTFSSISGDADDYGYETYGDWYRVWLKSTYSSTGNIACRVGGAVGGGTGNTFYVWGLQFEKGNDLTSYIPNLSTGTTTREADICELATSGLGLTKITEYYNGTTNEITTIPTTYQISEGAIEKIIGE